MTERYGSGYSDQGGQRPSGRGAVTERLARQEHGGDEIDLTDEPWDEAARRDEAEDTASPAARADEAEDAVASPAARPDEAEDTASPAARADEAEDAVASPAARPDEAEDTASPAARADEAEDAVASPAARPDEDLVSEREMSGAFEPAAPTTDPAATQPGSASIFDAGERAKQEDQNRTGYEPALADVVPAGDASPDVAGEDSRGADAVPAGDVTPEVAGEDSRGADAVPAGDVTPEVAAEESRAEVPEPTLAPVGVPAGPSSAAVMSGSLLGSLDAGDIRSRFLDIQAGFVDEPRQAVEAAGRFVDDLVQQVTDALQGQRHQLTGTTAEGSTEELRLALRAYRQFVDRLLGLAG
jgi:hypothetical protein